MKPKPLLALNHFTGPCSLLTALLFSVSRVTAEHYIELSDAPVPSPSTEPRPSSSFTWKDWKAVDQAKKWAASVTLRPLYYPTAIQEQQTQKQSTTAQVVKQG